MNPQGSKNGTSGRKAEALDPQAPKTETDEKMARHFNGIIFVVLAVLALGVLIAIWIFHHRGEKVVPRVNQKQSAHYVERPKFTNTSERGLESVPLSAG
jgi:hypothetical protein